MRPCMNMFRRLSAVALAVLASGQSAAIAQTEPGLPETQLRQPKDLRSVWPLSTKVLAWTTGIPMNLRYEEMSTQQQSVVKSQYENLGPNDEPPFPEGGLAPIIRAMHQAQAKLLVKGTLSLVADIDPQGLPRSVAAYSSPSPEMTRIAAQILMLTRFRPAKCAGEPCSQQFPLNLDFRVKE
jgi:hypothetical protein